MPMRRLLMVTYFFPPVGGVGVERTLKHVAYLPENGWEPVVLAPANSAYRLVDDATLERVPAGTDVHRVATLEPGHLRKLIGRVVGPARRRPASVRADAPGGGSGSPLTPKPSRARATANAAWAWAVPRIFFPDEQVLWAPAAVRAGRQIHAHHPVDAIYSSSPPISGHLAAASLARRLDLPWIADFRDPWIGNAYAHDLGAAHRALQRRLERRIVERASRVILPTADLLDEYAERYPAAAARMAHIPNGYDLAELESLGATAPGASRVDGRFELIYAGSLYGEQELHLFLDGMELLLARRPDARERLLVTFAGWFSAANQQIAAKRLPSFGAVVRQLGFLPKADVIASERAADAGLVLLARAPGRGAVAPAKTYEYLGLDLPVLAVAPPGELRRILEELHWGVVADPTPQGVADGIERLMAAPPRSAVADPERRYERRALTRRLAAILDEVTSGT
jgi:glycosyltransferase involved in cell wall biosynthesis